MVFLISQKARLSIYQGNKSDHIFMYGRRDGVGDALEYLHLFAVASVCFLSSVCWPTATASWNTPQRHQPRPCAPHSWNPSKSHTHCSMCPRSCFWLAALALWGLAVIVTAHVYAWCGAPQRRSGTLSAPLMKSCKLGDVRRLVPRPSVSSRQGLRADGNKAENEEPH